jgi:hypothetical protein
MARHRNFLISLAMLALQALLSIALIYAVDMLPVKGGMRGLYQAAAVACGLMLALAVGSIIKGRFLGSLLGGRLPIWRGALVWAVICAAMLGIIIVSLPPRFEWVELLIGIPAILGLYSWIIWCWGFGPDDRVLFKKSQD